MPAYTFHCGKCSTLFEVLMSIAKYTPKQTCPNCKSKKVSREYQSDAVTGFVGPKTLGSIAEKNADKLSADQKEHLFRKHNEYRFQPKPELPAGMKRVNRENPTYDGPRTKRPKREIQNL